ncbi:hypothetical protein PMAYCL1PPCAC_16379, partial [Pristionchus mayeri]
ALDSKFARRYHFLIRRLMTVSGALLGNRLTRRKRIPKGDLTTNLRRCLNTFDVTMIGLSHMVGPGIFVTTGEVMRNLAGPSTTLSYVFAGLGALLSALCYAEFGARYAGCAYTYAYVGCGEISAFIIGWNIILEYVLAAAAYARTFTGYLDELFHFAVREWTLQHARPWPFSTIDLPNYSSNTTRDLRERNGEYVGRSATNQHLSRLHSSRHDHL